MVACMKVCCSHSLPKVHEITLKHALHFFMGGAGLEERGVGLAERGMGLDLLHG